MRLSREDCLLRKDGQGEQKKEYSLSRLSFRFYSCFLQENEEHDRLLCQKLI